MKTVRNDWYIATIDYSSCVSGFEVNDMNEEAVCSGIAKWDGCMDFNCDGIHFCSDMQTLAFAEILCMVRGIAMSFDFDKASEEAP